MKVYNALLYIHPCIFNIHPCFQDEMLKMKPVFADKLFYLHMREKLACCSFSFSSIIVKVLLVSCFADYRANIGGLMW